MQTLEGLRRNIKSAEDLLSVVKTMKALAAVSIRQYERSVAALADYHQTITLGLQAVLQARRADLRLLADQEVVSNARVGAIVFGSDQGLCGQFNERIVEHTVNVLNGMHVHHHDRVLVAVGARCAGLLVDAGQPLQQPLPTPAGIAGITFTVQELLFTVEQWQKAGIDRVYLFHHQPRSGWRYQPLTVPLLPIDLTYLQECRQAPWVSRSLPTFTMSWRRLFALLLREALFIALFRACASSLASEEASRLMAMQNAERNITERLDELHTRYHHQRQTTITAELLDLVGGYEAVTHHG
ncbi:MAG TPA: F0F1 ATP synthase subunit gamma [Caldilineaceae bacterium]|nr:F0F1 ATP synthase subunit gamma [Caldilineaceae bacterium]